MICPKCDCINCDECGHNGCICNAPIRYTQASLDKAVAKEREECARIAETCRALPYGSPSQELSDAICFGFETCGKEVARAIRSRGTEPNEISDGV